MAITVNIVCYKWKTLSNGEHPLMLCICKDMAVYYVILHYRWHRIVCSGGWMTRYLSTVMGFSGLGEMIGVLRWLDDDVPKHGDGLLRAWGDDWCARVAG